MRLRVGVITANTPSRLVGQELEMMEANAKQLEEFQCTGRINEVHAMDVLLFNGWSAGLLRRIPRAIAYNNVGCSATFRVGFHCGPNQKDGGRK